jgi:pimeloyl-ACP methyl ester carboxylesterase
MNDIGLINYKTYGTVSQPALVVIHGLFGSLDNWQTHAKKWAEKYYVIAVDLRNHGRSMHSSDINLTLMSEDIFMLLQHLNILQCSLLGHSLGGKVAMQFVIKYPDFNIKQLIVVDIAPRKYSNSHQIIFNTLLNIDLEKLTKRSEAEVVLRDQKIDENTVQFLLKNLYRLDENSGYAWRFNLISLHKNYDQLIAEIKINEPINTKTIFISGSESNYINKDDVNHIKSKFTDIKFVEIPNSGHWVHADNPLIFNELIYNLQ